MTRKRLVRSALLSTTIWIAGASAAAAQTAPTAPATTAPNAEQGTVGTTPQVQTQAPPPETQAVEGEIVVTAQRREQRLQDVPLSVNVTSGESIQKTGVVDMVSLSTRSPGLNLGLGPQSNIIAIRGVGSGLNAGFEQSVGTFVDGVFRPRSRLIQAGLFDVERVEILNGPQTTFFGNNTVAGAINITTKKPSQTFGSDFQALYSPSDGQYILQAGVTGPISNTLSARLAVQASGMNGYTDNKFLSEDEPHLRDMVARGSLRWEPSNNFRSDFRFEYARNRDRGTFSAEVSGCPAATPPFPAPSARPNGPCALYLGTLPGGVNPDNKYDFNSVAPPSSLTLDAYEGAWTNALKLDNATITSTTSYSHQKSRTFLNAAPLPALGVAGYFHQPFSQQESYNLFAQELRIDGTAAPWLDYVGGVYYSHGDLVSRSVSSLYNPPGGAGNAGAPVTSATTPIESNRNLFQTDQVRSAFGQLTIKPFPQLRFNLGLRYTSVKKDGSRTFRAAIGNANAVFEDLIYVDPVTEAKLVTAAGGSTANFADPHTTYNKLMPAASIQYDVVPNLTAYAAFAQGFKAGGYSDSNGPAQFGSEFVDSYEIGIKGSALNHALFFTLDGFYLDYKGLQQALTTIGSTGASITTVGNAAASRSKGIEFSATLKASPVLSFNLSGAYIDSKFTDYRNAGCTVTGLIVGAPLCVANAQDVSGKPTPFAPKFSGTAGATFKIPVGDDYNITLDPNVFYSSGYYLTPTIDELLKQGRYTTVDMRVGFGAKDNRWEVAVIGKNLSNEKIKASGSSVGTSPGLVYALLQRARSVAFQVTFRP
ncbi:MAG: TonB-dependent receptor [Pseudomonadota bacterium]